jgi:hypothetical protein
MRVEFITPIESFTESKLHQAIAAMTSKITESLPLGTPFNIELFEPNDFTNRYVIRVSLTHPVEELQQQGKVADFEKALKCLSIELPESVCAVIWDKWCDAKKELTDTVSHPTSEGKSNIGQQVE